MREYHKIDTVFKRDPLSKFKTLLVGEFSQDAFGYLANNEWVLTCIAILVCTVALPAEAKVEEYFGRVLVMDRVSVDAGQFKAKLSYMLGVEDINIGGPAPNPSDTLPGVLFAVDKSSQLPFSRFSRISYLAEHNNYESRSGDAQNEGEESNRIIDRLIDEPRKRGPISVIIGALTAAIGIAIYLNTRFRFYWTGMILVCLGLLTPAIPWWLIIWMLWDGR